MTRDTKTRRKRKDAVTPVESAQKASIAESPMSLKAYIGIDPGKSGALAIITRAGYAVVDMPLVAKDFDAREIGYFLRPYRTGPSGEPAAICCLEKAQSMPGQGVTSVFNYGEGYGEIKAMLKWFRIPFEEIRPLKWKKEFSLSKDKKVCVAAAQKLFPNAVLVGPKGGLKDGRAEALLMAEYARRRM